MKRYIGTMIPPFSLIVILLAAVLSAKEDVPRLESMYAETVDRSLPLNDYPRPQLVRKDWINLNGSWEFTTTPATTNDPPERFDREILVPYAVESMLSGIEESCHPETRLWYKRRFSLSENWRSSKVLLHFEASDWETSVWLNGTLLGSHRGGYTPFSFDLSAALNTDAEQEIVVAVQDPTDSGKQILGRQSLRPGDVRHTAVSGIWQTVWLEPVPHSSIRSLDLHASVSEKTIRILPEIVAAPQDAHVSIQIHDGNSLVAQKTVPVGGQATFSLPTSKQWTPYSPFLYDLSVSLIEDGKTVDIVKSYFAMREVSLGKNGDGCTRILLNGRFLFQNGVIDYGMWPEGLYTPPSDTALIEEIRAMKRCGFNMLRKAYKVESARFYYHCDREGILVWQDIPGSNISIKEWMDDLVLDPTDAAQFETEMLGILEARKHHPSIIAWTIFNEGCGQHDSERLTSLLRQRDGSRLVNHAGGWCDRNLGDVKNIHAHPLCDPLTPDPKRATVLGSYGGFWMEVPGHLWPLEYKWGYGYQQYEKSSLTDVYLINMHELKFAIVEGLSAVMFNQWADQESEVDGIVTYDRKVFKYDLGKLRKANIEITESLQKPIVILPDARTGATVWKYTFHQPAENWARPEFDDSTWSSGKGGFGVKGVGNLPVGTQWDSSGIWLRLEIELSEKDVVSPGTLAAIAAYDDTMIVYINGQKVLDRASWVDRYRTFSLDHGTGSLLKPGKNTIAVHATQNTGGQFVDLGLVRLAPAGLSLFSADTIGD